MARVALPEPTEFAGWLKKIRRVYPLTRGRCASLRRPIVTGLPRGYSWGWFEIEPVGREVGFWCSETGKCDLSDDEIERWNAAAEGVT